MSELVLQCNHITQRFSGLVAVSDVSMEVRKNEIVGVIGNIDQIDRGYENIDQRLNALGDWYAAPGDYEIAVGASSRDLRLFAPVRYETARRLPVHIGLNTPVGELLENERTKPFAMQIIAKASDIFGGGDSQGEAGKEAISSAMVEAMALSQPLRGLVSFGYMTPDELNAAIRQYTD